MTGPGKPLRVVWKELHADDYDKFITQSNQTPSGGGARDLRWRPHERFDAVFRLLCPNHGCCAERIAARTRSCRGVLTAGEREPRAPRCRGPGPLRVVLVDQLRSHRTELDVQAIPVLGQRISLELVVDRPGHEAAQATAAHVLLDPACELFVNTDRPLSHRHG